MAEQSTQSIVVDAPAADVMAVIADFASYPQWVGAAKKAEVEETGDDDHRVTWTLVTGQMQKRQDGSYTLTEHNGSTEVTYAIAIDLSIPMLGMIKRKAEKVILDTALKELKKRVEG